MTNIEKSKRELTDRQQDILNFIQSFIEAKGYPPSLRDIGKHFNIASTFGVKRHLDALAKKGYLNIESNVSRALTLTQLSLDKSESEPVYPKLYELPLVGRVAAGSPILAVENIEGNIVIDPSMIKNHEGCFALKVKGDSMINAGIYEGDVLVIMPQKYAYNGEIVVALLGDEATVKRFEKKGDQVFLVPENSNYAPIVVGSREDFSIIGKVVGVLRWYN